MKSIKQFLYILPHKFKRRLFILLILLLFGMLFEMMSLGMIIPALKVMTEKDIISKYPSLQLLFNIIGHKTQGDLIFYGFTLLVIIFFVKSTLLGYLYFRQSKFNSELSAEFSDFLFNGYMSQPYNFHLGRNSSQLLKNIQGEVIQLNGVLQAFGALLLEISAILGITIVLFSVEPLGAICVTFILTGTSLIFYFLTKNKILKWGQSRQFHDGRINQHLVQGLSGVKDVIMTGRENYFIEKFREHNNEKAKILTKIVTIGLMPRLYLEFLSVLGLSGLILTMLAQNKAIESLVPTIGVFVAAAFRLIPSVNRILTSVQAFKFAGPVLELFYNEFEVFKDARIAVTNTSRFQFENEILLDDVSFKYANNKTLALSGITINIRKGESIGIIGPSGSGKSTLVDIVLGLLAPLHGAILVDEKDINSNLRGWQNLIGYIPQNIYLTDDTISRNVAFGISDDMINQEQVIISLKLSQLYEFVESLPDGIETLVGERGVRMSGGQRQRIAIARALYHNPDVLVLDEATSALDIETEKEVMQAVTALFGNKTLIIVAHRLSTIKKCDRIFELRKGCIVNVNEQTKYKI